MGESNVRLFFEGRKGKPMFILGDYSELTLVNLEIIYDGSEKEAFRVPANAKLILKDVKIRRP